MKHFIVLIGNYGSGKTEIAINLAVNSAAKGLNTLVVDLDKVNDYFRMSDRVELLKENNINLVSPTFAGQGVTPSNMSAAVASAFAGDWDLCVFDVGGDAAGAMSLGRYHTDFAALEDGQLEVYDIVNVFRPMSESPEKIIKLKEEMEGFARLEVTGFVNNSNLLNFASADDIRQGYDALLCPMIDARRMEVYAAVYDRGLNERRAVQHRSTRAAHQAAAAPARRSSAWACRRR